MKALAIRWRIEDTSAAVVKRNIGGNYLLSQTVRTNGTFKTPCMPVEQSAVESRRRSTYGYPLSNPAKN